MTPSEIARGLSKAQREALLAIPALRCADPVRWQGAITRGNSWRKATKHWREMWRLETCGLVERKLSRGETLWRHTLPLGLEVATAVRAIIEQESHNAN